MEIPVYIPKTKTLVQTIEIPQIIQVNNTVIHYIPTPMPLKDFSSKAVFLAWIWTDDTDTLDYADRFNCMDYTLRTIRNAELDGYRIYFFYDERAGAENHAVCMAYMVKEAKYVIWEPQSDVIQWEWDSNLGG